MGETEHRVIDLAGVYHCFLDGARKVTEPWLGYLAKMGISEEVVHRAELRVCGKEYKQILKNLLAKFPPDVLEDSEVMRTKPSGKFGGCFDHYYAADVSFLLFPYLRNGKPVFLRARPLVSPQKLVSLKLPSSLSNGEMPCPYNFDALHEVETAYICRGEMNTLVAASKGLRAVGVRRWERFDPMWCHWFKGAWEIKILIEREDEDSRKGVPRICSLFQQYGYPEPEVVMREPGQNMATFFDTIAADAPPPPPSEAPIDLSSDD